MLIVTLILSVLVSLILGIDASSHSLEYTLDDKEKCDGNALVTKHMDDEDIVLVRAKGENPGTSNECVIMFGTAFGARKKSIRILITSFSIVECSTFLAAIQSSKGFFGSDDSDVKTMFNLSCSDNVNGAEYFSDAGNNIKIYLHKTDKRNLNFNFLLNVTLAERQTVETISTIVFIGLGVLLTVSLIGVGFVICCYLKVRRRSKRQFAAQYIARHGESTLTNSQTRHDDMDITGSIHSEACIIGSTDRHGLCTVCHRQHEDFAHVVDIGPDGEIHNEHSLLPNPHHHNTDDYTFVPAAITRGVQCAKRSRRPRAGAHSNRNMQLSSAGTRLATQSNEASEHCVGLMNSSGLFMDDNYVEDEDIDLSGNDLVPPSYDLSPPTYDEAISMPKPDSDNNEVVNHNADVSETDPLYQNVVTIANDGYK